MAQAHLAHAIALITEDFDHIDEIVHMNEYVHTNMVGSGVENFQILHVYL